MPELWEHQRRGIAETVAAIEAGEQAICLTSPTGGGKTRMVTELIQHGAARGWPVSLYTNRTLLREQLEGNLSSAGIEYGIRAGSKETALLRNVQLSMMQTEISRVYKAKSRELHPAKLVLVDECHNQAAESAEQIINDHIAAGATVVGITATPLGIGHIYKRLVVAGCNSELRECGALVPCETYGPDEPDTRHVKKVAIGEDYSERQISKMIMVQGIFGRVFEHWKRLNPDARPTILYAPGVKESIWFAEQFRAKGIRWAHIDGDNIWLDGETFESTKEGRADIIAGIKDGSIKGVSNRFVLREGIDIPELFQGIFATVFGKLASFLQSGGRLLRNHPSLDKVIIQDHGGSWWRHGSLNADREWSLNLDDRQVCSERCEAMREKRKPEPIVCPKCSAVRLSGPKCYRCGFSCNGKSRIVVQADGSLRKMAGDILKPRRVAQEANTESLWKSCYYTCKNARRPMTFTNVRGLFYQRHGYYPPNGLPLMPKNPADWHSYVKKVSYGDLHTAMGSPPAPVQQPQPHEQQQTLFR